MTDNDIIKALECCANNGDCKECAINPHRGNYGYCTSLAIKAALDLINRQKAEIERLKGIINTDVVFVGRRQGKTQELNRLLSLRVAEIKSEAIKEFAENLKKDIQNHSFEMFMNGMKGTPRTHEITYEAVWEYIDNLVKEMTEGEQ